MQVDIRYSPAFAVGVIAIPAGGEIKAEAGAMTSMSGGVEIETKAQGGVMAGLKRSVLGGESFVAPAEGMQNALWALGRVPFAASQRQPVGRLPQPRS